MTPDDQAAVRALNQRGRNWQEISALLSLNANAVRAIVDDDYRACCAARTRAWHISLSAARRLRVTADLDGLDLTARLMGDPPPGRPWPKSEPFRSRHDIASDRELELRIRRALSRPKRKAKREPVIPPMKTPPNPVRLLDRNTSRREGQCSTPLGDTMPGGELLMCGRPVVPGTSWCRECGERVFVRKAA